MTTQTDQPAGETIIEVENFAASYGGKTVLKDVNFSVQRGEVLVIAGGSGCGKSTMLFHMIGLYRPAAGRILIEDMDVHSVSGASWIIFGASSAWPTRAERCSAP